MKRKVQNTYQRPQAAELARRLAPSGSLKVGQSLVRSASQSRLAPMP